MRAPVKSAAGIDSLPLLGEHEAEAVPAAQAGSIDYRSIVESTLAKLTENTRAARHEVYTHARTELSHQLQTMAMPQPIIEIETIALDFAIAEIERQWQTREGGVNPLAEPAVGSLAADQNLSPPHRAPPAGLLTVTPRVRFRPIGLAVGLPLGIIAIALAVGAYDGAALQSIIKGWGAGWFPHTNVATGENLPVPSEAPGRLSPGRERPPAIDPQIYYGPTPVPPIRAEFSIAPAQQAPLDAAAGSHVAAPSEAAELSAGLADYTAIGMPGAIFTQPVQPPVGGSPPAFATAIPAVPPVLATQPAAAVSPEALQPASASAKPLRQANAKIAALIDNGKRAVAKADLERAVSIFTEAIRLDPKYPEAYVERGQANFRLGETDRAIADYSAAIQRDPQFGNAFRARGMAYLYRGSSDLALADLNRAIALAESDARLMAPADLFYARRSRASINDLKRHYDQEIADYTALVQSYMRDPALVASLAANYGEAGAANMLATIYRQRALAELHLSDPESAIADLTDAIPLSSDHGYSALIDRARIHESRGERAQAIADLQAALDVRPGSDEARLGLKRLGASPSPGARPAL